jgi:Tfp pilus assembly protein PilN
LAAILILTTRSSIESLRSEVTGAETSVTQQQQVITALNKQIGPIEAAANELSATLLAMERGRATFQEDVAEVEKLAGEKVILTSINHGGSSLVVAGTASSDDNVFRYAEDLRASKDSTQELRFSRVWIASITENEGTFTFQFSLTK